MPKLLVSFTSYRSSTGLKLLCILLCILAVSSCDWSNAVNSDEKDFTYTIDGPLAIDTSMYGRSGAPYEQYLLSIENLQKDIYVPFTRDSSIYRVTSWGGVKWITPDSLQHLGGITDYFSENLRMLERGEDHEFSIFLPQPSFIPDTVFVSFKYYPDSITAKSVFLEMTQSPYIPILEKDGE